MRSLKVALFAGAAIAAAFSSAQAADLGPIMQAPRMLAPAQVEEQMGGWYLRGDIGVGSQKFKEFDHVQTNQAFVWPASWRIDQRDMGDAAFVGGGFGFQWNSWLRFDATAEYRMKTSFKAIGSYTEFCPGGRCFDVYDGNHSAVVLMANAYVDLGTWMCLTPFVGAGAGYARHSFTRLQRHRLHLRRHHGLWLCGEQRLRRVEVRLGGPRRRRLQRQQQLQDGTGVPLPELRQRQHLRSSTAPTADAPPAADRAPTTRCASSTRMT